MKISCRKATELIEKGNVFSLSRNEKVLVQVHLLICKTCSTFEKESKAIDIGLERMMNSKKVAENIMLSEDLKSKIKGRLI